MRLPDFVNEPLTDFSVTANREAFVSALQRVSAEWAREYLLVVGGEQLATGRWIDSVDPREHTRLAGRVAPATPQEAERALDFDEALRIANNRVYGLTSGVYSRDRHHLRQAEQEFQVGNLYLNRRITGALVGVEPFGGPNLSGTDSKAGGPDYLKLFMEAKAISERL